MYRDADEIEKEKELFIYERGLLGMFRIVLFMEFLLFILKMWLNWYIYFIKLLRCIF